MILLVEPISKNYGAHVPTFSLPLMEIGSFVKKNIPNVEIKIISMSMDYGLPLTKEGKEQVYQELLTDISDMKPKAIGFSCTAIAQGQEVIELFEFIKEHDPHIFTFVGGYFPTIYYEDILARTSAVDLVVVGEGEVPALMIIERLMRGQDPRNEQIPNLAWKKNGQIHLTQQDVRFDLKEKATFDLSLLRDHEAYDILPYAFSRGCPHHCHYCMEEFIRPVRKEVPHEIIQQDLTNISRQNSARFMWMCDPLFMSFDLTRFFRKFDMKIFFETRCDIINPAIIPEMVDVCGSLAIGFESASYNTLKRMNKVKDRNHYEKYISSMRSIFKEAKKNEIPIMVFMIAGYPGDTIEDLEESLAFAREISKNHGPGGHFFKIGECRIYPKTKTHYLALSRPDVIFDDDGVFGENVVRQPSKDLGFETVLFYMKEIFNLSEYTPKLHQAAQRVAPLIRLPIQALKDDMIPNECYRGNDRSIFNAQRQSLAVFAEFSPRLREKYKQDMSGEKTTRYLPV